MTLTAPERATGDSPMAALPESPRRRTRRSSRRAAAGKGRRTPLSYVVAAGVTAFVLAFLAPFLIILINSFKTSSDYRSNGPLSWPEKWNWDILDDVWERTDFTQKLLNSVQISLGVVVIAIVIALFNAYAIGIGRVRWRNAFLIFFLAVNVLPQEGVIYPVYYLFKEMGLYDTKLGYTILLGVLYSAFGTYLLSSVYAGFPRELLEAAQLDGASRWTVLWRIVLPMSWPTLSVMCVFFFVWSWNEFLTPLVLLISNDNQTVPLGLAVMRGQYTSEPTALSAAALLGVIPMIVFFLIFQRTLTRGVTAGAVK
ncbi:carbohydrate ABC transporter permease [Streptomyces sp. NBC_01803]|uniref:carbohydrate ABC transporter permease n=1 Tax=Streptomyces sp. NBC_01803 TaxID=2975946 RepID=UPI002DD90427|nr:carbohydrate ABC transporter permease [Streptomyces sp. NBC_01803]WSA46352.1 carbohydrate ABC transporter permease [Streptomyces sp. NBC_01803]